MNTTQEQGKHTKWEVWSDPIENAKTVMPKYLVLTAKQEFVAECRDADEAKLIAKAPALLAENVVLKERVERLERAIRDLMEGVATPISEHPWAVKQRNAHNQARAALNKGR